MAPSCILSVCAALRLLAALICLVSTVSASTMLNLPTSTWATGVWIDASNRVYIADSHVSRILYGNAAAGVNSSFSVPINTQGGTWVNSVWVNPVDGSVYVAVSDGPVEVFANVSSGTAGQRSFTFGSQTSVYAAFAACDGQGNLYLTDIDNAVVRVFSGVSSSSPGTQLASWGANFYLLCAVALDASGMVYAADYYKPSPGDSRIVVLGSLGSAQAGVQLYSFSAGFSAQSVAVSADGSFIYVADFYNGRIVVLAGIHASTPGQAVQYFPFHVGACGVAVDALGNVWATHGDSTLTFFSAATDALPYSVPSSASSSSSTGAPNPLSATSSTASPNASYVTTSSAPVQCIGMNPGFSGYCVEQCTVTVGVFVHIAKCEQGNVASLDVPSNLTQLQCAELCTAYPQAAGCWWSDGTGGWPVFCRVCFNAPDPQIYGDHYGNDFSAQISSTCTQQTLPCPAGLCCSADAIQPMPCAPLLTTSPIPISAVYFEELFDDDPRLRPGGPGLSLAGFGWTGIADNATLLNDTAHQGRLLLGGGAYGTIGAQWVNLSASSGANSIGHVLGAVGGVGSGQVQEGTAGWSFEVVFKPTGPQYWAKLFDLGETGDWCYYDVVFGWYGPSDSQMTVSTCNGSGGQWPSNGDNLVGPIVVGDWVHAVVVFQQLSADGSSAAVVVYLNGQLELNVSTPYQPTYIARTSSMIGRSSWTGDSFWQGEIDLLRVFSIALNAEQADALYFASLEPAQSPSLTSVSSWYLCASVLSSGPYLQVTLMAELQVRSTALMNFSSGLAYEVVGVVTGVNSALMVQNSTANVSFSISGLLSPLAATATSSTVYNPNSSSIMDMSFLYAGSAGLVDANGLTLQLSFGSQLGQISLAYDGALASYVLRGATGLAGGYGVAAPSWSTATLVPYTDGVNPPQCAVSTPSVLQFTFCLLMQGVDYRVQWAGVLNTTAASQLIQPNSNNQVPYSAYAYTAVGAVGTRLYTDSTGTYTSSIVTVQPGFVGATNYVYYASAGLPITDWNGIAFGLQGVVPIAGQATLTNPNLVIWWQASAGQWLEETQQNHGETAPTSSSFTVTPYAATSTASCAFPGPANPFTTTSSSSSSSTASSSAASTASGAGAASGAAVGAVTATATGVPALGLPPSASSYSGATFPVNGSTVYNNTCAVGCVGSYCIGTFFAINQLLSWQAGCNGILGVDTVYLRSALGAPFNFSLGFTNLASSLFNPTSVTVYQSAAIYDSSCPTFTSHWGLLSTDVFPTSYSTQLWLSMRALNTYSQVELIHSVPVYCLAPPSVRNYTADELLCYRTSYAPVAYSVPSQQSSFLDSISCGAGQEAVLDTLHIRSADGSSPFAINSSSGVSFYPAVSYTPIIPSLSWGSGHWCLAIGPGAGLGSGSPSLYVTVGCTKGANQYILNPCNFQLRINLTCRALPTSPTAATTAAATMAVHHSSSATTSTATTHLSDITAAVTAAQGVNDSGSGNSASFPLHPSSPISSTASDVYAAYPAGSIAVVFEVNVPVGTAVDSTFLSALRSDIASNLAFICPGVSVVALRNYVVIISVNGVLVGGISGGGRRLMQTGGDSNSTLIGWVLLGTTVALRSTAGIAVNPAAAMETFQLEASLGVLIAPASGATIPLQTIATQQVGSGASGSTGHSGATSAVELSPLLSLLAALAAVMLCSS